MNFTPAEVMWNDPHEGPQREHFGDVGIDSHGVLTAHHVHDPDGSPYVDKALSLSPAVPYSVAWDRTE